MTVFRLQDRIKFLLERWMQRGVRTRLLFIAGVIVFISLFGGVAAWLFSDQFPDLWNAVWWAFLRLTDPGYLGDDAGAFLRTLSTVITVLGYVVFLGSLVAILTEWLNSTMRHLESGLTPIAARDHVLILGWSNRTPTIVRELLLSEDRVRRFLRRRGARRFRVVILADEVTTERVVELREYLEDAWDERRIILRSGSSLRLEHLRRVAYRDASVVIIPGADFLLGGAAATDARVIKTLISLSPSSSPSGRSAPAVVAEVFDSSKVTVAENSYRGGEIDVVASDAFIGRLIAQNIRHRGLSFVYSELLSHSRGNEVYVRSFPEYDGAEIGALPSHFRKAVVLGAVRRDDGRFASHLNPGPDFRLRRDDRLVFVARSYEDCTPDQGAERHAPDQGAERRAAHQEAQRRAPHQDAQRRAAHQGAQRHAPDQDAERHATESGTAPEPVRDIKSYRRILILGWSHKVMSLLREFSEYPGERFDVDVLSRVAASERESVVSRLGTDLGRLGVRQMEGDYTIREDVMTAEPGTYDNIVFLASDWMDSEEESDARTILGYILLRSIFENEASRPEMLIELMDPENARLFRRRTGEVIISPLILSHILAHVALRRELNAVFNELFAPGGAEFFFRPASQYEVTGRRVGMAELRNAARRRGEIALGVRLMAEFDTPGGGLRLNPSTTERWTLLDDDEIVVLATTPRRDSA